MEAEAMTHLTLLPPPRFSLPPLSTLPPLRPLDVDRIMAVHCQMVDAHERREAATVRPVRRAS
jgi:hypothetical protein